MKKVFYLSTCDTCQKIIAAHGLDTKGFLLQDIKHEKITPEQLDEMQRLAGSYEQLFSRRAMQYKARGLKDSTLTEQDYRTLILEEYTFLKRPVILFHNQIFVGSEKKTMAALSAALAAAE